MKVTQKKNAAGVIEVEALASTAEVSQALNNAQMAFAQQMNVRPDGTKSVTQAVEEQLGIKDLDAVVAPQAIEFLVPFAIDKTGVIPAFPPSAQGATALERGKTCQFNLTITPRPNYTLTSYDPVEITVVPFSIDEQEVEAEIAQLSDRYAEFVTDDPHPVAKGESCLLALESFEDGKSVPNLTTEARTYTTGIGLMPDDFDSNIIGMNVGETKTFSFDVPDFDEEGKECSLTIESTVTVKEIQKRVPAVIDDAWVEKYMPMYRDAKALRGGIADRLQQQRALEYEQYKRGLATEELAKRFEGRIADEVYEAMSRTLVNDVRMQVAQQGMTWEQFLQQQGGEQQFNMMLMMQTRQMLVQGYALDALFLHEGLAVSEADFEEACASVDPQNPRGARERMESAGHGFSLREAAERIKASKWLVEHASITIEKASDPSGA